MEHLIRVYGLPAVFFGVLLESAGVPVPGETMLIAASVLAAQGDLSLTLVIAVAAVAAIIGDNVGYWMGRAAGRRLLRRWGPVARYADKMLPPAERFFARHGGKAVFFARFIAGIRVVGAVVAGFAGMDWRRFLLWNAAGGIVWAISVALAAYYLGRAVASTMDRYGVVGGAVVLAALVVLYGGVRGLRRLRAR